MKRHHRVLLIFQNANLQSAISIPFKHDPLELCPPFLLRFIIIIFSSSFVVYSMLVMCSCSLPCVVQHHQFGTHWPWTHWFETSVPRNENVKYNQPRTFHRSSCFFSLNMHYFWPTHKTAESRNIEPDKNVFANVRYGRSIFFTLFSLLIERIHPNQSLYKRSIYRNEMSKAISLQ